jgi:hypothetical protein
MSEVAAARPEIASGRDEGERLYRIRRREPIGEQRTVWEGARPDPGQAQARTGTSQRDGESKSRNEEQANGWRDRTLI